MNEPIISPWLFYWMSVVDKVKPLALGVFIFAGLAAVIIAIIGEGEWKTIKPFVKTCGWAVLVSGLILVFVPGSRTITKMVIASYATPQNIEYVAEKTGKAIDGGIDYMIDKIVEAADKWEARKGD